jgi:hypothetical protein
MIDNEKVEKVSHTIDEVLVYLSNTYEIEPLLLASLVLARVTVMCDETNYGADFRTLCHTVATKSVKELTSNETKVG